MAEPASSGAPAHSGLAGPPAPPADPDSQAARKQERALHRQFAVQFNNEAWDLIDGGASAQEGTVPSPADKDAAVYSAYAAARHWAEAGTVVNRARGEHLIARAAVAAGLAGTALRHARKCLALVQENPDQMADWDAPFAHEALARALAATGDVQAAREHRAIATRLAGQVAEPRDRQVLAAELDRAPWFGLDGQ